MEIPRQAEQARSLLHRAMKARALKAVPAGTGTSGDVPDAPSPNTPAPAAQTTGKWRDGELGFLDEQLGDSERMSRYNVHLIIKYMGRVAVTAAGAAVVGTGAIRESATTPIAVYLVIASLVVTLIALVGMTVLLLVPHSRSSTKKTLSEPEREVEQTSNAKAGEDGDQSGHHAPDQQ